MYPFRHLASSLVFSLCCSTAFASDGAQDGAALMGMCNGADKVRALSVMCHSYTSGFIESANYYASVYGKKPLFCLRDGDKSLIPNLIATWMKTHSEQMKQPAGKILNDLFSHHFSCKKS